MSAGDIFVTKHQVQNMKICFGRIVESLNIYFLEGFLNV